MVIKQWLLGLAIAFAAALFWIPSFWLALFLFLLAWRFPGDWQDLAFALGLGQFLFSGHQLLWWLVYLLIAGGAYWQWGKKNNRGWRIS